MIDLGRWVNEEYRVPGKPVDPESTGGSDDHEDSAEDDSEA